MTRPAIHVIERFPEHELTIERLVRTSESFRSMCEDYAAGAEALERWERVPDPKDAVNVAELRESLAELDDEIRRALEQETGSRPAGLGDKA